MAILSIMGLYNYDNNVFSNLQLPQAKVLKDGTQVPAVDKELLTQNILIELAELEFLYPDPLWARTAIGLWSAKNISNWERLHETAYARYELLNNYDRTEEITDSETVTKNVDSEGVNTNSNSGSTTAEGENKNSSTNSGNNTKSNSAYNNTALYENEKTVISDTTSNNGDYIDTGTFQSGGTNTDSRNISETTTRTNTHSVRAYGNIGVTTSQQMITEERKLLDFDIYSHITQQFKERFCICVY